MTAIDIYNIANRYSEIIWRRPPEYMFGTARLYFWDKLKELYPNLRYYSIDEKEYNLFLLAVSGLVNNKIDEAIMASLKGAYS